MNTDPVTSGQCTPDPTAYHITTPIRSPEGNSLAEKHLVDRQHLNVISTARPTSPCSVCQSYRPGRHPRRQSARTKRMTNTPQSVKICEKCLIKQSLLLESDNSPPFPSQSLPS